MAISGLLLGTDRQGDNGIPLPEHPRPDFERSEWCNLNGYWGFQFSTDNQGLQDSWFEKESSFTEQILVPYSWGAPLSGIKDEGDITWYSRSIEIPKAWTGKRVFLVVGASDWETFVWINGRLLGTHRGGYTPFEFELTPEAVPGKKYQLVLRVDDSPHEFKLEGKQGYGPARGIWQTPYLEARGSVPYPNSYPMTDEQRYPSTVRVRINGSVIGIAQLQDDPADHRGILSWHPQLKDRRLREAGSYGYLTRLGITRKILELARSTGEVVV